MSCDFVAGPPPSVRRNGSRATQSPDRSLGDQPRELSASRSDLVLSATMGASGEAIQKRRPPRGELSRAARRRKKHLAALTVAADASSTGLLQSAADMYAGDLTVPIEKAAGGAVPIKTAAVDTAAVAEFFSQVNGQDDSWRQAETTVEVREAASGDDEEDEADWVTDEEVKGGIVSFPGKIALSFSHTSPSTTDRSSALFPASPAWPAPAPGPSQPPPTWTMSAPARTFSGSSSAPSTLIPPPPVPPAPNTTPLPPTPVPATSPPTAASPAMTTSPPAPTPLPPPPLLALQGVVHKIVSSAADVTADLSRSGRSFHIIHEAVSHALTGAVDGACADIPSNEFFVMINHARVETFEQQGKLLPSELGGKDGPGGRVMLKCGGTHPVPPARFREPRTAAFCELASLGAAVMHALNYVFPGAFHTSTGPTMLRSFGRCRRQLVHVDKLRPKLMDEACPAVSVLVALRDANLIMYPGSQRYLPEEKGGKLTACISPVTVLLKAGDLLMFRQDVAHAGAAIVGTDLRHRWHWYVDGGVPDEKEGVFTVRPLTS